MNVEKTKQAIKSALECLNGASGQFLPVEVWTPIEQSQRKLHSALLAIDAWAKARNARLCTTDIGDGSTMYDMRPRVEEP